MGRRKATRLNVTSDCNRIASTAALPQPMSTEDNNIDAADDDADGGNDDEKDCNHLQSELLSVRPNELERLLSRTKTQNDDNNCKRKFDEKNNRKLSRRVSGLLILFVFSIVQCLITTFASLTSNHFFTSAAVDAVSIAQRRDGSSVWPQFYNSSLKTNVFDNATMQSTIKPSSITLPPNTAVVPARQSSLFDDFSASRSKRYAPPNMRGFTETQILDELFKNYDNRTRPFGVYPNGTFGGPTRVRVNILLRSISKIDDVRMEYTSTITFREEWADQRLAYDDGGVHEFLVLSDPNKVWKPDLFFYPEKEGWFHAITTPNVLFRIYGSGRVLYSVRLSMVLSCFMQLHLFPLDYQNCTLDMASYAYTTDDIIFYWKEDNPVQLRENILNLPRFQLENVFTGDCTVKTNTGAYSCLKVELHFLRQLNYFIFQTYVPSIMLVIASWVSFWLDQDAIPARITLGVTTLLTVITSTHSINAKLPPVSYTKAIDVWTGACTFFVFAALIEFALVNYASRRERPPAPPGGKRALRKRAATSTRHRALHQQHQQQQQQLQPPQHSGNLMPYSSSGQPSPMHHYAHQPLHNVYSDAMDSETALFLANNNNNNNTAVDFSASNQFVDVAAAAGGGGSGGTPRETSFHRFPAPGEEDLFDFTGGPHLRVTGPSFSSMSNNNNNNNNNNGQRQQNHQRLSGRSSSGNNNRMNNNNTNDVATNFLCDRLLSATAPLVERHFSRNSLALAAADCGGLFPPPPPLTTMSPSMDGRNMMYTTQPSGDSGDGNGQFQRSISRPAVNVQSQGDVAATTRQRGLIGKYFRWPASKAKRIDFVSRVLFPTLFSVFNCIYWSVYVTARDKFRRDQQIN